MENQFVKWNSPFLCLLYFLQQRRTSSNNKMKKLLSVSLLCYIRGLYFDFVIANFFDIDNYQFYCKLINIMFNIVSLSF